MPQRVGLLKHTLNVAGLGRLVLKPDLFQVLFGILAL